MSAAGIHHEAGLVGFLDFDGAGGHEDAGAAFDGGCGAELDGDRSGKCVGEGCGGDEEGSCEEAEGERGNVHLA